MYEFDSDEEKYFSWYLKELTDIGLILKWTYHPKPFLLSDRIVHVYDKQLVTKVVAKDSVILNDHKYQADFHIHWNPEWKRKIFMNLDEKLSHKDAPFVAQGKTNFSVIDVKGPFIGRNNNSAITFPLDQKWVYQKYKIYVQKIIPSRLFAETFTPARYLLTDMSGKARKIDFRVRGLAVYLKSINE